MSVLEAKIAVRTQELFDAVEKTCGMRDLPFLGKESVVSSSRALLFERDSFIPRRLEAPNQFIIEVNKTGFNVYRTTDKGERELIATSASVLTFASVMEKIIHEAGFNKDVHFLAVKLDPMEVQEKKS